MCLWLDVSIYKSVAAYILNHTEEKQFIIITITALFFFFETVAFYVTYVFITAVADILHPGGISNNMLH